MFKLSKKKKVLSLLLMSLLLIAFLTINIFSENSFNGTAYAAESKTLLQEDVSEVSVGSDAKFSAQKLITKSEISMDAEIKSFVYVNADIIFVEQSIIICSEEKSVELLKYNWYNINYYNSNVYAADVMTDIQNPQEERVAAIFVYPNGGVRYLSMTSDIFNISSEAHVIELLYLSEDMQTCYKLVADVSEALLKIISSVSESYAIIEDSDDYLSGLLMESFSFENSFKSQMYDGQAVELTKSEAINGIAPMSLPTYGSYANSARTVTRNSYDNYTDTDALIKDYINIYRDKVHKFEAFGLWNATIDDPIVNIIPKTFFQRRGVFSYIGKEYGFYIKTVQDYDTDNRSDFFVFDIISIKPYPGRMGTDVPASIEIRPVFESTARYSSRYNMVYFDSYLDTYLGLANIQVAGAISNLSEKNIGDVGYDKYNDYGYAFNSMYTQAKGVGIKRSTTTCNLSFVKTVFGAEN